MLEAEPFNLMSVDLNLPKMDGLQVISIARRKFPQLRMVVLTGIRTSSSGTGPTLWRGPVLDQTRFGPGNQSAHGGI